jgi:hypothetical protein
LSELPDGAAVDCALAEIVKQVSAVKTSVTLSLMNPQWANM